MENRLTLTLDKIKLAIKHMKATLPLVKDPVAKDSINKFLPIMEEGLLILEQEDPKLEKISPEVKEHLTIAVSITEEYYNKFIAN